MNDMPEPPGGRTAAPAPRKDDRPGSDETPRLGLVNLQNTDVLHNVNAVIGVCENSINVLGVQVPLQDVANGIGVPC